MESGCSSSDDESSFVSQSQSKRQKSSDDVSTSNEGILFKDKEKFAIHWETTIKNIRILKDNQRI